MKDDCIFCKLAGHVFETNIIYEDDDFTVILDANPATRGHALILPKEHYADLYEIPDELLKKAASLAKKIVSELTEKLGADGYNIVQNNGEKAGQTVFHFHIHLIPRYENDGQLIGWKPGKPGDDELKALADKIRL
ncbi:MAG: HIT family protein [Lachnospiraceae bacterium]|nr:HIT family protein [Lachnospiraceae bacterium]